MFHQVSARRVVPEASPCPQSVVACAAALRPALAAVTNCDRSPPAFAAPGRRACRKRCPRRCLASKNGICRQRSALAGCPQMSARPHCQCGLGVIPSGVQIPQPPPEPPPGSRWYPSLCWMLECHRFRHASSLMCPVFVLWWARSGRRVAVPAGLARTVRQLERCSRSLWPGGTVHDGSGQKLQAWRGAAAPMRLGNPWRRAVPRLPLSARRPCRTGLRPVPGDPFVRTSATARGSGLDDRLRSGWSCR